MGYLDGPGLITSSPLAGEAFPAFTQLREIFGPELKFPARYFEDVGMIAQLALVVFQTFGRKSR